MTPDAIKAGQLVTGRDGNVYRIGKATDGGANFRLCRGTTTKGEPLTYVDRLWVWGTRIKFGPRGAADDGEAQELRVVDLRLWRDVTVTA